MKFNKEIPIVESYKFNRKEYDYLLFSLEDIWNRKTCSYGNPSERFYEIVRNVWAFGVSDF